MVLVAHRDTQGHLRSIHLRYPPWAAKSQLRRARALHNSSVLFPNPVWTSQIRSDTSVRTGRCGWGYNIEGRRSSCMWWLMFFFHIISLFTLFLHGELNAQRHLQYISMSALRPGGLFSAPDVFTGIAGELFLPIPFQQQSLVLSLPTFLKEFQLRALLSHWNTEKDIYQDGIGNWNAVGAEVFVRWRRAKGN